MQHEKTVIPIGNFDMTNKICPDIDLKWQEDFTLLGFYINIKLEKTGNESSKY